MDSCRIQKLLLCEEYAEFEDQVIIEGPFVEINSTGKALSQVYLGFTRDNFILAKDDCDSFEKIRWENIAIQFAQFDPDVLFIDILWHIPICHLQFNIRKSDPLAQKQNILVVTPRSFPKYERYFILAILGVDGKKAKKKWKEWDERLQLITEDAEGYVRQLKAIRMIPEGFFDEKRCLVKPVDTPLENQRRHDLKTALFKEFSANTHIQRLDNLKALTTGFVPKVINGIRNLLPWETTPPPPPQSVAAEQMKNADVVSSESEEIKPPPTFRQRAMTLVEETFFDRRTKGPEHKNGSRSPIGSEVNDAKDAKPAAALSSTPNAQELETVTGKKKKKSRWKCCQCSCFRK